LSGESALARGSPGHKDISEGGDMIHSLTQIATALGGRISGHQVEAPGPGHSANDHSMSVLVDRSAPDGFVVNSFCGDDPIVCRDYVRSKLGLPAFKPNGSNGNKHHQTAKPRVVATYRYADASGVLLYEVQRHEPKDFRQRRPDGRGGWIHALGGVSRVLYRLPELLKYPDATVFVCEGEKDVDRLASENHCATTISGGAKWTREIVAPLKGRDVVVLEDNDDDGRTKALAAAHALHGVAASIRIVSLPDLPDRGDVSDWLNADPARSETFVDVCIKAKLWTPTDPKPDQKAMFELFWHGKQYDRANRLWLVKDLIPETGTGLLSGQWGTAKTFVALDLAASIVSGVVDFAGREITLRGGVLFIAAEGASEISIRLQAVVQQKLVPHVEAVHASGNYFLHASYPDLDQLPFAWIEDCPSIKTEEGYAQLLAIVKKAADQMFYEFGVPLVLIVVDTLSASAEFDDQNDAAEAQRVMNRLADLSRKTGAFALAVDHFGKVADTGTRGSSAKEAAADVVLALLGERELSGALANTRMAVRKLRGGGTGAETPFDLKVVEIGDNDTTCIIDWRAQKAANSAKGGTTKGLRCFLSAVETALMEHGKSLQPYSDGDGHGDGFVVRAAAESAIKQEFKMAYPGSADAKKKEYSRVMKTALDRHLIVSREVGGVDFIWLSGPAQ
jgi:AAA domain